MLPNGSYLLKSNIPVSAASRAAQRPGDIKYRDINGDLIVNANDYTVIGRGLPIHTGGISNNFMYKGFDLNVFFQWSYGNDIVNGNRLIFDGGNANPYLNRFATYADRWTPTNPSNKYFRAGGGGTAQYSSRVIEDGSYIRLKTVSLGYNLAPQILRKINVKGIRVYASAQNILTWTNYTGPDAEVSVRNSVLTPGFDWSAYPRAKTIVFGLNVTF